MILQPSKQLWQSELVNKENIWSYLERNQQDSSPRSGLRRSPEVEVFGNLWDFPFWTFFSFFSDSLSLHRSSNNSLTREKINWYKLSFHFFRQIRNNLKISGQHLFHSILAKTFFISLQTDTTLFFEQLTKVLKRGQKDPLALHSIKSGCCCYGCYSEGNCSFVALVRIISWCVLLVLMTIEDF